MNASLLYVFQRTDGSRQLALQCPLIGHALRLIRDTQALLVEYLETNHPGQRHTGGHEIQARLVDLLGRDFSAAEPNLKWCGDLTEIPTTEGKLYLAAVEDLFSRRLLGFAISDRHDAELAVASLRMAAAVRGGSVTGVIFHTDQGSEYTSGPFAAACRSLGVVQSMGRVGSALDNAAAESFFSTLEHELLSRHQFATRAEARRVVASWIDRFYNRIRRHSTTGMRSPIDYELAATTAATAA